MKKNSFLKIFLVVIMLSGFFYVVNFSVAVSDPADTPVSTNDLKIDYSSPTSTAQEKVHILIVPGHEPGYGGAEFGAIKERNLVTEIGADLKKFLETNKRYQVSITRDSAAWNPVFADYFKNEWNNIIAWENTAKQTASRLAALGAPVIPIIDHVAVPDDVALRLYGINKWANENSIDLMVHLHLNDYPGHSKYKTGIYSGLVIYTPAVQYANSSTTKEITNAVFKRLSLYNPVSNLSFETDGIIDDPELIAVGANNTANAASMLIEYNYIYEPQFVNPKVRALALKDLAYQTYLGLQDYFNKSGVVTVASSYDPVPLYDWQKRVTGVSSNPKDIYALQTALIMDNDYPPLEKDKNSCPHSGTIGVCTRLAIQDFQKKNGITNESVFGRKTFSLLNAIYSGNH